MIATNCGGCIYIHTHHTNEPCKSCERESNKVVETATARENKPLTVEDIERFLVNMKPSRITTTAIAIHAALPSETEKDARIASLEAKIARVLDYMDRDKIGYWCEYNPILEILEAKDA